MTVHTLYNAGQQFVINGEVATIEEIHVTYERTSKLSIDYVLRTVAGQEIIIEEVALTLSAYKI